MQQKPANIPPFDERGNLPSGIHEATIEDVISYYGGKISLKRKSLAKNLQDFCTFIKQYAKAIYIDGSFITNKLSPGDVDLLVIISNNAKGNSVFLKQLQDIVRRQKSYNLHIFVHFETQLDKEADWLDFFTRTRKDENGNQYPKGIISLELNHD